jgi:Short-chain dehydrogenases of various substrate specificities
MREVRGRVAAITGAGSGIGRALALELARRGCEVALADRNAEGLDATAAQVGALGVRVSRRTLDVAEPGALAAWAQSVVADHGRVNLIFNNAGVALISPVQGMSEDELRWIMDINFWGVVRGTQAFLPHLQAAGEGHVINVASVFGLMAVPSQGGYNASKFAVRGFTEALRMELELARSPVSATVVLPGGIRTAIADSARYSEAMKALSAHSPERLKADFGEVLRTSPERAARVILAGVRRNRRRVLIGADARFIDWLVRWLPAGHQRLVLAASRRALG